MLRSGTKVCCPSCGARHIVRPNEVDTTGRVELRCVSCGTTAFLVETSADTPQITVELNADQA